MLLLPQPAAEEGKSSPFSNEEDGGEEGKAALVFKISVTRNEGVDGVRVHVRWLEGMESVLFESFCGWLKRRVETAVGARK